MAQTCTQIGPHKPGWLNGRSAISLSLSDLASWSLQVLATGHGGGGISCIGMTMMVFTARALLDSGRACAVALVPSYCPCF